MHTVPFFPPDGNACQAPHVDVLRAAGVLVGVKVDRAFHTIGMGAWPTETITQGLDDLGARCDAYYARGVRFAKWRALFHISGGEGTGGPTTPSELALNRNCDDLARYAAICQQHGLMPIVEPDVVMDGGHGLGTSARVTKRVLATTFRALDAHGVDLARCQQCCKRALLIIAQRVQRVS